MSCQCKLYQKRFEKVQKKYATLKKNNKKLLGVTILLTEALEELIKGENKPEINDTLSTCSSIYPDLFRNPIESKEEESENLKSEENEKATQLLNVNEKISDTATESEKEYFEGFMARPKIPRTPQV